MSEQKNRLLFGALGGTAVLIAVGMWAKTAPELPGLEEPMGPAPSSSAEVKPRAQRLPLADVESARRRLEAALTDLGKNAQAAPTSAGILAAWLRAFGPKHTAGERSTLASLEERLRGQESPPSLVAVGSALSSDLLLVTLLESGAALATPYPKAEPDADKATGTDARLSLDTLIQARLKRTPERLAPTDFAENADHLTLLALYTAQQPKKHPLYRTLRNRLVDTSAALKLAQGGIVEHRGRGRPTPAARQALFQSFAEQKGLYADPGAGLSLARAILRGASVLDDQEFRPHLLALYADLLFRLGLEGSIRRAPPDGASPPAPSRTARYLAETLQTLGLSQLVLRGDAPPPQSFDDVLHPSGAELLALLAAPRDAWLSAVPVQERGPLLAELVRALRLTARVIQLGTPR